MLQPEHIIGYNFTLIVICLKQDLTLNIAILILNGGKQIENLYAKTKTSVATLTGKKVSKTLIRYHIYQL